MFVTMVLAALVVDGALQRRRPDPDRPAPTRDDIFGSIELDYKLALNVLGRRSSRALFWLTARAARPTRSAG